MRQSGTFLGSRNIGNPFAFEIPDASTRDRSSEVVEGMRELGLDGFGIEGDVSLALLKRLAGLAEMPLICIPKTIDNDVGVTEVAIGYDTAVQIATEALDRLRHTAASHGRVIILEVVGRDAGHIALVSGIAGGADVILIPEIPYDLDRVAKRLESAGERGHNFVLMIIADAVAFPDDGFVTGGNATASATYGGVGHALAAQLSDVISAEIRVTVLGYVQCGGVPMSRDSL
jgi:6-phosphofructokinase